MNQIDVIDLSSDDDEELPINITIPWELRDSKFLLPLIPFQEEQTVAIVPPGFNINNSNNNSNNNRCLVKREAEGESPSQNSGSCLSDQGSGPYFDQYRPVCRQFWKSGDYEVSTSVAPSSHNGRNRLRINPRFLHSNATSHKWAFGAIAELLDNAIDEVHNGATFVNVDKFVNPRDRNPALLIQDDGGGMDPESLRRCMSFGFSDKQSESFIGQYGNGFKTSTMRLGADVIVFTRSRKNMKMTQSVGLLSYTFLTRTGCDDIVVPMVDYELDQTRGTYRRHIRQDQRQFSANLSVLLKWSPFTTESDLSKQFDDIGDHGMKIIVFNLWFNDDGHMELDFYSDSKDILISGAQKPMLKGSNTENLTKKNVATRLRFSLRAYASVLYLHIPNNFKIILRGQTVDPHHIANDLIYRECILYKPQIGGTEGAEIYTTIGFVKGAPNVDVQGFNVYHKNRLISPFWKVANNSYGKGRGVVGILEANFIKPTHDKQDFEKSTLYQRLESRLKDMTYEYWDLHSHLVGYDNKKLPKSQRQNLRLPSAPSNNNSSRNDRKQKSAPLEISDSDSDSDFGIHTSPGMHKHKISSLRKLPVKRKYYSLNNNNNNSINIDGDDDGDGTTPRKQERGVGQKRIHEMKMVILENKKLREQCAAYEEAEKQLSVKEQNLRAQLEEAEGRYHDLLAELESLTVKMEKS